MMSKLSSDAPGVMTGRACDEAVRDKRDSGPAPAEPEADAAQSDAEQRHLRGLRQCMREPRRIAYVLRHARKMHGDPAVARDRNRREHRQPQKAEHTNRSANHGRSSFRTAITTAPA